MPSLEFINLVQHPDPVIRQVIFETFTFGLRYGFVTEALLSRCENLNIPFEVLRAEIVRQYDEMPSKEFH